VHFTVLIKVKVQQRVHPEEPYLVLECVGIVGAAADDDDFGESPLECDSGPVADVERPEIV